jgi:hypothetical protein
VFLSVNFLLLALCLLLLCFSSSVSAAPKKLTLGLPTVVTLKDDKSLCPLQVDLPSNLGGIQVLVDIITAAGWSLGQRKAVIYAAPGDTIVRDARYRYNEVDAADQLATILKPAAGLWTIGVLAQCPDVICFGSFDNYDARVTVVPLDAELRPRFVLENNRRTGYVSLKQFEWAYATFRLTSPAKVWLSPSSLNFGIEQVVARRTTAADLASGTGGLPVDTDQSFGNEIDGVDFVAGTWVIGIQVTKLGVGQTTSDFDLLFSSGSKPTGDFYPDKLPADYCPSTESGPEEGTWDECKNLPCSTCMGDFGKAKGCLFCTALVGAGSCGRRTSCGVTGKALTAITQCDACRGLPCGQCLGKDGCSYCDTSNQLFQSRTCQLGACNSPQDDLRSLCIAQTNAPVRITLGADGNSTTTLQLGTIDENGKTSAATSVSACATVVGAVALLNLH